MSQSVIMNFITLQTQSVPSYQMAMYTHSISWTCIGSLKTILYVLDLFNLLNMVNMQVIMSIHTRMNSPVHKEETKEKWQYLKDKMREAASNGQVLLTGLLEWR